MTGIPAEGVSRESLRDGLNAFGTVKYVDFSFGEREAWVRYAREKEEKKKGTTAHLCRKEVVRKRKGGPALEFSFNMFPVFL